MTKVFKLPAFVYISKLWENHKKNQDDLKKRKMEFLEEQAFQNFYEQLLPKYAQRSAKETDFHPCFYAERAARAIAREVVLQVDSQGRINHCYKARIDELRKGRK